MVCSETSGGLSAVLGGLGGLGVLGMLGVLGIMPGLLGCERISHAGDFEVLHPTPHQGICNICPPSPGLRHPPCPTDSSAPDRDELFVYVWRYYRLGFDPNAWTGPDADDFKLGYDLDCSTRLPTGRPVMCQARSLPDGTEGPPWIPLPHGIDNAMSQRILGPLFEMAKALGQEASLDEGINAAIAEGGSTVMIVVENWNGTPNDPKVSARIVSSAGISKANGGPPRWDGQDLWDALSDGVDPESVLEAPNTTFKTDDAYVANGTLVFDLRVLGVSDLTVLNKGAIVRLPVHDLTIVGNITENELQNLSVSGKWALSDMKRELSDIADFLSGCDPLKRAFLMNVLPNLMETSPDLPMGRDPTPGQPCSATSIGFGADAFRARVGGYRPISAVPGGCS